MKQIALKNLAARLAPPAIMILSAAFLFRDILLSGTGLYGSDFLLQFYPWKKFVYDHVWSHGSIPFWNPYLFSGTPFITNIQASLFYPLGFFYYLLPPQQAYVYSTLLHCVLGCLFMYRFMRDMGTSLPASCFSAVVFTFNGYFMAHVYAGHLSFVQNYIWIPLVFLFLRRFVDKRSMVDALAAGLVLGVQILGGFPQIAFYTLLGSLAYVSPFLVMEARRRSQAGVLELGAGFGIAVFIGFALAAVQVLPTLEFTGVSTRAAGVSYFFATLDSLHPKELLAFLIPEIFGNPTKETYWVSTGAWHFWETCGYVGVLPLFLLFVKEDRGEFALHRVFFTLLILVSLFLALGKYNPLYPLIYKLPGFSSFRIPAQIIFLCVFSAALLSGVGFDRILLGEWRFNKGLWVFVCLGCVLIFLLLLAVWFFPYNAFFFLFRNFAEGPVSHVDMPTLYHHTLLSLTKAFLLLVCCTVLMALHKGKRVGNRIFIVLAFFVLAADLYPFCKGFVKAHDYRFSQEKEQIIKQFSKNSAQGRVATLGHKFRANDGMTGRFPSILGYDPLILRRYAHYLQASQGTELNDHLVNLEDIDLGHPKLLKNLNLRQVFLDGEITLFPNDIPYANVVYDAIVMGEEDILPFMQGAHFDPRTTVVLEQAGSTRLISHTTAASSAPVCAVLHYESDKVLLRASTQKAGYLVLSEVDYPGWQAIVDGKEVPIRRGNFLFRVIPLDAGEHEVELQFVSWPFRVGGVISLVTLLVVLGGLWLRRRGRRA
jgi:hypothetical protein